VNAIATTRCTCFKPEEFALPSMCAMRGQAYVAETTIGQELMSSESVKVMCIRHVTVGRRVG
jgi:hypothetical protein